MKTNNKGIRYIALLLLLTGAGACFPLPAWAETISNTDRHYRDSLRSYIFEHGSAVVSTYLVYPIGDSVIDPDFGDNASELAVLQRFLDYALRDTLVCVRQVRITGHCSPDGSEAINQRLSDRRATRLLRYLEADYHISENYPVEVKSLGADWTKFRKLIAASPYKWKNDALLIIDSSDPTERKKVMLSYLGGGDAHRRMYEEFYPRLRRVEIRIDYDVECMKDKLRKPQKPDFGKLSLPRLQLKTLYRPARRPALRPLLALKTNLLFDVAMMPNVELEVPIGNRWSVNAEWMFPWWLIDGDKYCLQILSGGIEGRYWLGDRSRRRVLTGHFVGFYAGAGKYDLQWDTNGYQGEFYVASGVSYGYVLPLARRLNMEFSIGIGLMKTSYEHYHTLDNFQTLLWQNDGRYTWLGPTKAKISLVWLIGRNKKGGRR